MSSLGVPPPTHRSRSPVSKTATSASTPTKPGNKSLKPQCKPDMAFLLSLQDREFANREGLNDIEMLNGRAQEAELRREHPDMLEEEIVKRILNPSKVQEDAIVVGLCGLQMRPDSSYDSPPPTAAPGIQEPINHDPAEALEGNIPTNKLSKDDGLPESNSATPIDTSTLSDTASENPPSASASKDTFANSPPNSSADDVPATLSQDPKPQEFKLKQNSPQEPPKPSGKVLAIKNISEIRPANTFKSSFKSYYLPQPRSWEVTRIWLGTLPTPNFKSIPWKRHLKKALEVFPILFQIFLVGVWLYNIFGGQIEPPSRVGIYGDFDDPEPFVAAKSWHQRGVEILSFILSFIFDMHPGTQYTIKKQCARLFGSEMDILCKYDMIGEEFARKIFNIICFLAFSNLVGLLMRRRLLYKLIMTAAFIFVLGYTFSNGCYFHPSEKILGIPASTPKVLTIRTPLQQVTISTLVVTTSTANHSSIMASPTAMLPSVLVTPTKFSSLMLTSTSAPVTMGLTMHQRRIDSKISRTLSSGLSFYF